jgi:RNA polymerase sigma-70 factor (ECF subfamily)
MGTAAREGAIIREERMEVSLNGALDQVYSECRQQLFTCALAITRCPDIAEDAIQEAFYRLFRLNCQPQNIKAYVFRAVRNAAIDQVRKNSAPVNSIPEFAMDFIFDSRPGPADAAMENEFQRRVAEALMGLVEDERETIVQHLYGNLTFREIAEVREAPLGTVTSWYQRGLEKLRARLEG